MVVRYSIRVNVGDDDRTVRFQFAHKDFMNLNEEQQNEQFDKAVKELDHIYKDYGRFATTKGVCNLFESFGFIQSTP